MNYHKTTQVPNTVFDQYLSTLTHSELKVYLYIIRQTYGWKLKNGKRKSRDRISYSQFEHKTGVSKRMLSTVIQSLIDQKLIYVTDFQHQTLHNPELRKGKRCIYYAPYTNTCATGSKKKCKKKQKYLQRGAYNKTNFTKLKVPKRDFSNSITRQSDALRIQEILASR